MRSTEDFRARLVERVGRAVASPSGWSPDPDSFFTHLLHDLAFIDETEEVLGHALIELLHDRGLWSPIATKGSIRATHPRTMVNSVSASEWGRVAHRMGWLTVDHVAPEILDRAVVALVDLVQRDGLAAEAMASTGPPSIRAGRSWFALVDEANRWLYVDLSYYDPPNAEHDGRSFPFEECRIVGIRLPTASYFDGVHLTPRGRQRLVDDPWVR